MLKTITRTTHKFVAAWMLFTICGTCISLSAAAPTLRLFPQRISLKGESDQQSLVVQRIDEQGTTQDVTSKVKLSTLDSAFVELAGNTIRSKSNGETKIVAELNGERTEIPVTVSESSQSRPVSFRLDVMPVFMKYGCNNGSCHGAARGKDGFHLSLFGYDPAGDYFRLTRQLIGRRLDLAVPEKSLLLEKPTGLVQHTGGKLFNSDSDDYKTFLRWIASGAPDDTGETPTPVGIELLPPKMVFDGQDLTQTTVVLATYSDGSVRDVSRLALFLLNNEAVAGISKDGIVKANGRGGAFVFARFNKFTVGSEVIILPTADNFQWPKLRRQIMSTRSCLTNCESFTWRHRNYVPTKAFCGECFST